MPQPKGKTGNPNGRPKGTPNKLTKDLREWLSYVIDENRPQMIKDIQMLEPMDRLRIMERLISFVLPKPTESKITFNNMTDEELDKVINQLNNTLNDNKN